MLVTKLFLLLNLVVDVYLMTEEELKIIIHFHQDNNSAAVDESGTDYILDHKNQAAANGIDSSPYGSSWTTRSSWTRPDKCGDDNLPCEDCGYYDCQESDKCKWSSGSGNGNDKWRPQGPYGVC